MINTFSGEFLSHPIPFEMSENACSHRCTYCFASVREKKQSIDIQKFANWMKNINKDSWKMNKLREGYPVCFSNNTDPFSKNNELITESILEYFKMHNIRVFFQTKGGARAAELIKAYGLRSVVYVTMTTDREDISRRIEPNAPAPEERIQLIKELKAMGNEVIVGVNPYNSHWISDEGLSNLLKNLTDIGVYSFVFSPLYLRKKRLELYKTRDLGGVDVSEEKCEFKDLPSFFHNIFLHKDKYKIIALATPFETHAFDIMREVYEGKVLGTTNDFINLVLEKNRGKEEFEVRFEDWRDWFIATFQPFFTETPPNLLSYLFCSRNSVYKKHCQESGHSLERMAAWYWNDNLITSPHNNALFPKELQEIDKNRNLVLHYKGEFISKYA